VSLHVCRVLLTPLNSLYDIFNSNLIYFLLSKLSLVRTVGVSCAQIYYFCHYWILKLIKIMILFVLRLIDEIVKKKESISSISTYDASWWRIFSIISSPRCYQHVGSIYFLVISILMDCATDIGMYTTLLQFCFQNHMCFFLKDGVQKSTKMFSKHSGSCVGAFVIGEL
jgi:hypothetical protein